MHFLVQLEKNKFRINRVPGDKGIGGSENSGNSGILGTEPFPGRNGNPG